MTTSLAQARAAQALARAELRNVSTLAAIDIQQIGENYVLLLKLAKEPPLNEYIPRTVFGVQVHTEVIK